MICLACGWDVDNPSISHSSIHGGRCYGTQEQTMMDAMEDTLLWKELRDILAIALIERLKTCKNAAEDKLEDIVHFLEERWNPAGPPRQREIAALRQKVRELEKEVEQRGEAIKAKNTEINNAKNLLLEWSKTHKEGQG